LFLWVEELNILSKSNLNATLPSSQGVLIWIYHQLLKYIQAMRRMPQFLITSRQEPGIARESPLAFQDGTIRSLSPVMIKTGSPLSVSEDTRISISFNLLKSIINVTKLKVLSRLKKWCYTTGLIGNQQEDTKKF